MGDAGEMVVPTMQLRRPDGRSLDVFLAGPEAGLDGFFPAYRATVRA